nr:hypothetical protein GCM10020092_023270 [Actinoplanes digitatis]
MNYGVILPGGTAPEQLQQAVLAEQSGWDGVFVWESASGVDAWSLLAAIAAATTRIRLGTMLTPLPWRRPWKVASQVATVDQLSAGRAVLGIGVGALDADLPQTGEVTDLRERAAMMDEGIDLIRTLWAGGTSHHGPHYDYQVEGGDQAGRPVQQRIPIWVVAVWPRPKSLRRVLKCDGVIPNNADTPPTRSASCAPGSSSAARRRPSTSSPRARHPATTPRRHGRRCRRGSRPAARGGWRPAGRCRTTAPPACTRSANGSPLSPPRVPA